MRMMIERNLKVFFRDKTAVFFSLLGVLIILGLYVLFLGDLTVKGLGDLPGARFLVDSWIMAGLLAVASVTTTMGAFGIMVEDRSNKVLKDFYASPLSRRSLAGGYIASAFIIGVIISLITLVAAEAYILVYGGKLLPFVALLKVLGCILLSVLASSSIVFFIISFLRTQNAFGTASSVIGTLIGFLTGIYMPVGVLPAPVQYVIKIFPISHAGALFRQIMLEAPLANTFAGAPAETLRAFEVQMGVVFEFGGTAVSPLAHILVLLASSALFYALALWNISRKRK